MYARLSRFAGLPPERIEQTIRDFQEGPLAQLAQLDGFGGAQVMIDRAEGKAAAITYWETLEALRASDRLADQARKQAIETGQPSREPIVDRYEVVVER
jgi:heme-degrading monooxygenase HmoA